MRWLYCWRCRQDMPMLDEEEYRLVAELFSAAFEADMEFRQEHGLHEGELSREERFRPCLDAYERITGFRETNPNAVMHHRLAMYGPPCSSCGKPLRTPQASRCLACGAVRSEAHGRATEDA